MSKESRIHAVDKYGGKWTDEEIEMFFVFCQLNRVTPYPTLCKIFDAFIQTLWQGTIHDTVESFSLETVKAVLKNAGYRFYNQTTDFLHANTWVTADWLRQTSREHMVEHCKGFGWKLASLFLRNIRKENYAVIDIHIKRFLEAVGVNLKQPYLKLEEAFQRCADANKVSMYDLDMTIWQSMRVKEKEKEI